MKPMWISETNSDIGLTVDDHCFVALVRQEDGDWKPTTWLPQEAAELIAMYGGVYGVGLGDDPVVMKTRYVGDDCPGGHRIVDGHRSFLPWVEDYGQPQEGCPECEDDDVEVLLGETLAREVKLRNELAFAEGALGEAEEELRREHNGHAMSRFFSEVYRAKGFENEKEVGDLREELDRLAGIVKSDRCALVRTEEELELYKTLFAAERAVADGLLYRLNELEGRNV